MSVREAKRFSRRCPDRSVEFAIMIREARPSDKEPLMAFIKDVWGGHDYIPHVWDSWIDDRAAKMYVVEVDGKQVGMSRIRVLPDGIGWLEGARIHPEYRGLGLASMAGRYIMRKWRDEKGLVTYRLTSGSYNKSAHRQVAKMGFGEISRVSVYGAPRDSGFREQKGVWKAKARELGEVRRTVEGSKEYRSGGGVYWDSFSAVGLTPKVLEGLVRDGLVYRSDGAAAIGKVGGEGEDTWRQVCFATGEPREVTKLIKHVFGRRETRKKRQKAVQRGERKLVYAPQGTPLISTVRQMGLTRAFSLVLFEGNAPKD
jgi:GNAT superfamily N-acetyltransferase